MRASHGFGGFTAFLVFIAYIAGLFSTAVAQPLPMKKLQGLKPRAIGPAGMSGRVAAIDVVRANPSVIYIGTASGGLWKSTSGGIAWEPLFDDQPVASVGAVAIDQRNPDIVWAGTGEGNPRNSQTCGDGIYKSLDGGKSWKFMGLKNTRAIHRIIIHPHRSDIVYAAAQGAPWGENDERGIYKTTDGGASWTKILYVDTKTGAADLVMDPTNPNKLFAAMWQYRRYPWFFESGGPGSGLYVTFDGGATWSKRTHKEGLPKGDLGRIGLAIAPSAPNIVYALVEAKKNGLYRSTDGGFSFKKMSDKNIGNRPFYYADIYVDPHNENRVYNLYSVVSVSEDGGKSFTTLIPWSSVHPDHHAWWIHPDDPNFIIDGNDGGLAISRDRGKTWRFVENLPLAQFYHISVDNAQPYRIYGGMQDNGSWRGPSRALRAGGIRNSYWEEVSFGDGFDVVPDRNDPRYGYAMWQGGNLVRYDALTGQQRYIKPTHPDSVRLRFNWNAAIADDPFDPTAIYFGSQFVHKTTDQGASWQILSPDLTTNDSTKQRQIESGGLTYDVTNAENFTTIIAIEPSPLEQGVLWVGTDDGNVQLTKDGGATWNNVVERISGPPAGTWVPQIRASRHRPGEAFVLFDNHRRNDWTPYVYRTTDYGASWTSLADTADVWGYALALAQDHKEPNLLFLGTEFGLYVSIDAGAHWTKWTNDYPTVSTMDLAIHPREPDLIIGTFGRAAYVLDDIEPLRELARNGIQLLDKELHAFAIPDAIQYEYKQAAGTRFAAQAEFSGDNKPYGALITFVANLQPAENDSATPARDTSAQTDTTTTRSDSVTVEIIDSDGRTVRTLKAATKPGVNRIEWELDRKGTRFPNSAKPKADAPEPSGDLVPPGIYTVRISNGAIADSASVVVQRDPRLTTITDADIALRETMLKRIYERVALATTAADRLRDARNVIDAIAERLKDRSDSVALQLKKRGGALKDSLTSILQLYVAKEVQGIRRDPSVVGAQLAWASFYLSWTWDAPGQSAQRQLRKAEKALNNALTATNAFFASTWNEYEREVRDARVSFFDTYEPLQIE